MFLLYFRTMAAGLFGLLMVLVSEIPQVTACLFLNYVDTFLGSNKSFSWFLFIL